MLGKYSTMDEEHLWQWNNELIDTEKVQQTRRIANEGLERRLNSRETIIYRSQ